MPIVVVALVILLCLFFYKTAWITLPILAPFIIVFLITAYKRRPPD